jgi:hypothetical protein
MDVPGRWSRAGLGRWVGCFSFALGCACSTRTRTPPPDVALPPFLGAASVDAAVDATSLHAAVDAGADRGCPDEPKPMQIAVVGDEVFVAGEAGSIVAIQPASGRRRVVACGFEPPVFGIGPGRRGSLLVVDGAVTLWELSTDGRVRRRVAEQQVAGFAAAGDRVVYAEMTDAGVVSVRLAAGAAGTGSTERELARIEVPEMQPGLFAAGADAVVVAGRAPAPKGSDWVTIDLQRIPLDGGRPLDLAYADSVVSDLQAAGPALVWYTNGWRGTSWGGGYGTCELVVQLTLRSRSRVLRSFGPGHGDLCDTRLWFVVDGDAVVYRTGDSDALLRQPLRGGPSRRVGTVPRDAVGLVRDAGAVYWLASDGSLGRQPL